MFKVNKGTGTTHSGAVIVNFELYFTSFSSVFIVDFEQVNLR